LKVCQFRTIEATTDVCRGTDTILIGTGLLGGWQKLILFYSTTIGLAVYVYFSTPRPDVTTNMTRAMAAVEYDPDRALYTRYRNHGYVSEIMRIAVRNTAGES
jgi:hypothetical protein